MLTPVKQSVQKRPVGGRFYIIASRYNAKYVDSMLRAAKAELRRGGAAEIRVVRVPGAYEVPIIASRLAGKTPSATPTVSAIICLGVILRGETVHAAHIGEAVSSALMQIQLQSGVPIIHEVLLLENADQARVRCLGKEHNRGTEAAQTALAMAQLLKSVPLK